MTDQPTIRFALCKSDSLGRRLSPACPCAGARFMPQSAAVGPRVCLPCPSVPARFWLSSLPLSPSIAPNLHVNLPIGRPPAR